MSRLRKWFHAQLPDAAVSRLVGSLTDVALAPPLQARINHLFASWVGIDLDEAAKPPHAYPTLNAFFTRRLREGVRPLCRWPDAVISPVDGLISQLGPVPDDGMLQQIKGSTYSLAALLGDAQAAQRFRGGSYATIYLSPRDYHRIHAPVGGHVVRMRHQPGRLLPVNHFAVRHFPELFVGNERLISWLETPSGQRVAVVKVGATCVGRISVSYDPHVTNQVAWQRPTERTYDPPLEIARGDELGVFNLGSTVVMLIEGTGFRFNPRLAPFDMVKMGGCLGRWTASGQAEG